MYMFGDNESLIDNLMRRARMKAKEFEVRGIVRNAQGTLHELWQHQRLSPGRFGGDWTGQLTRSRGHCDSEGHAAPSKHNSDERHQQAAAPRPCDVPEELPQQWPPRERMRPWETNSLSHCKHRELHSTDCLPVCVLGSCLHHISNVVLLE